MKIKEPFKWILIAILLLSLFTSATYAQSPALTITDYTIQPEILTPGELGTVTVTIKNTAVNTSADITDIYLFAPRFEHDHKSFEHVGMLGGGSSTSITFAFKAPKVEGIYFPEIHIVYRPVGSLVQDTLRYPFPVRVNERTALKEASLEVGKDIPKEIRPGDDFTLSLKLTNRGETAAHDIFVEIGEVQAIYSNDPSNYYIEHLEPGKGREIQLRFRSSKDTPTGTTVIPIDITYEGLVSEVKKQSETAGIEVIGIAELSISNIKTDPLNIKQGKDFTLLVRIENAGDGDAKSVKATITDLPFSGVKEAFLGKIEPDDDSPAVFTLIPNESGNFNYHLQISYKDDSGDHTITEKLSLVVEGNENNGILNVIIIAILIALAGTCFYFYSKKKKKG
ncbi:MAG: hypothetical protein GQ523_10725 [Methanophagales archaeon]|jgi:hypothetical protein|nr:hypothetical protein [Methanophagales archaeon]